MDSWTFDSSQMAFVMPVGSKGRATKEGAKNRRTRTGRKGAPSTAPEVMFVGFFNLNDELTSRNGRCVIRNSLVNFIYVTVEDQQRETPSEHDLHSWGHFYGVLSYIKYQWVNGSMEDMGFIWIHGF